MCPKVQQTWATISFALYSDHCTFVEVNLMEFYKNIYKIF